MTSKRINYIHLKNFKSFHNATINFQSTKEYTKNMSIIFGENGSGKSSIVESISFLNELIYTRSTSQNFEQFMHISNDTTLSQVEKSESLAKIISLMQGSNASLSALISNYRTVGCTSPLSLTIGFKIGSSDGEYQVSFDESTIIQENLIYIYNGRKTTLWEIDRDSIKFYSKLFSSSKYSNDINEQLLKYWGKHSFLSILYYELTDKADAYIKGIYCAELLQLLTFFTSLSFSVKHWDCTASQLNIPNNLYKNIESGTIMASEETSLDQLENALTIFFKSIFTNVENAYYKRSFTNTDLEYELMLRKKLNGHIIDVSIEQESSGTQELLYFLPYLVSAMNGEIVFIDEFGSSLHEQLVPSIIHAVEGQLKGQLIITSHHLSILDKAGLTGDVFYYITAGSDKDKKILCTSDIESRLNKSYNYRNRYLTKEEYHLLPIHDDNDTYINFDAFLTQIDNM